MEFNIISLVLLWLILTGVVVAGMYIWFTVQELRQTPRLLPTRLQEFPWPLDDEVDLEIVWNRRYGEQNERNIQRVKAWRESAAVMSRLGGE